MYIHRLENKILTNPPIGSHIVKICQNEIFQINAIIHYIIEGLRNNESIFIIVRPTLRKAIISKLMMLDLNVQILKDQDQIKFFDTEFLLTTFKIRGAVVEKDFKKSIQIPMLAMQAKYIKVRTFNDMVDLLWNKGEIDMALRVEDSFNNLFEINKFSILCTYFLKSLNSDVYEESLKRISNCHTHLISS